MANKIILKKSSVASKVPVAGDLDVGELAVNLADAKLYTKDAGGTVIQLGGGSGSGDVVGPSSATDNALARFDGTTGKLIQNGTVTQDDNGNLANVNAVTFDTTPATLPTTAGSMFWDTGNGTPSVILDTDVTLQVGQEMLALVYNGTGSTITNGSVVAVVGAQGQRPSVALADADSESLSAPTLGIATEDIANGAEGFVTTFGFVRGINTSAFTAGLPIYLSQTAGQFTQTRPSAPAHTVALGWVIKVNASSGEVFVNINNGWELDELHNVLITSPTSGNTLIYDAVAGVWENANISAGTGISVTNGAGSISIANTGVTSVGATSPIASSGGATPTISISQATTSTNGYLSSTDWNTFNNKQPAGSYLTTVTVSSPLSGSGTAGSPLVIAQATTSTSGYLSSTDWNTFNGKQAALVSGTNIKTVNGTTLLGSGDVSVGVTSVTGIAPISSSGGATPAISISQASSTTNGYLSSTDWNTFNNKTSNTGTVTSVSATVPTGLSISGSPITTSGTLAITYTAGYSIPTTASQTNWDTAYSDRLKWDGGSTGLTASTGRTSLGATTLGSNLFTITNPSAVTFPRFNADNTVSALDAATFRSAIGAGTGSGNGTVTSVSGTGTVSGLTLSGTVTTSGSLTLGGTLSVANSATTATSANTASAIVARDASGNFSAGTITATLSGNATSATSATTATTATTANALNTGNNYQVNSLGVGTAGSGTAGEIRATNNVTAYYSSDATLKENVKEIDNALDIVCAIGSKTFDWTDEYIQAHGGEDGYFVTKSSFGVIAQDVEKVFPQAVRKREDGTLAVDYEKLAILSFGAIDQLLKRIEKLESK